MNNNIKLNILPSSSESAVHVEVCFNSDKDNGVLYFTSSEYEQFADLIRETSAIVDINDQRYGEQTQEFDYDY